MIKRPQKNLQKNNLDLFAVQTSPLYDAVAAFLVAGKPFARIAFDVDQEPELACILGAASVAIAVGALVINHGIDGAPVLA